MIVDFVVIIYVRCMAPVRQNFGLFYATGSYLCMARHCAMMMMCDDSYFKDNNFLDVFQ